MPVSPMLRGGKTRPRPVPGGVLPPDSGAEPTLRLLPLLNTEATAGSSAAQQ